MELKEKSKTNLADLSLKAFCGVSAAFATSTALAAPAKEVKYEEIFGSDAKTTAEINTDNATATVQSLYNLLKVALVVIGLFIFAGGIFQLIKANKSQGQISPATGWMMIFGGATLSVAGAIFFALGGGIKSTLVSG